MSSQQRAALIFGGEGLSRAIASSAGQIRIEGAGTTSEILAVLSTSPIDIVVLPWSASPKGYSVARTIKRRYPGKRLVFFDRFANHPFSRHRLDELGFGRAALVSTRVLAGFFQSAMLHLFPELFPDDCSSFLLEFIEFDIELLGRIIRYIEMLDEVDEAARVEVVLDRLLQSHGYEIDMMLPIMQGGGTIIVGGKLDFPDRYLYMLLLTTGGDRGVRVDAISKLLFLRSSYSSEPSCVAITRFPSLGKWSPGKELKWHLEPEPREKLRGWVDRAMDLFIRDLTLRYFRISRQQESFAISESTFNIGRWQPSGANR